MHITVHYLTQIRRAAGCSSESITVPDGCTLDALLHQLAERREPGFRSLVLDDANIVRRSLLFFIGDEHAELSRVLRDGEAVSILAPMAGG